MSKRICVQLIEMFIEHIFIICVMLIFWPTTARVNDQMTEHETGRHANVFLFYYFTLIIAAKIMFQILS